MNLTEIKRLTNMCSYEDELFSCGFENIAGADEVGRGSLAGPIVAAAVIIDRKKFFIEGLNDSKKIPTKNRLKIFKRVIKSCKCWSISKVSPGIIDRISLGNANKLVLKKAVSNLKIKPDIIITDALDIVIRKSDIPVIPIINGDELSSSIAAASIIAKVFRDRMMLKLSRTYPEYYFEKNKGYGTREHIQAIKTYGPSGIHRLSYKNFKI
jgi:ribonuclease HII